MNTPRILISGEAGRMENYANAVVAAGGEALARYCPKTGSGCEGLLLAGGGDMEPARFGEPNLGSREIDPARDEAELLLIAEFMAAEKPILGICRGHQVLNLALGGRLIQDLPTALALFHNPEVSGSEGDLTHSIAIREGSRLARWYGSLTLVNSTHHQSIDRVGRGMTATARSESGLNEAAEHETLPIITVQFHPERMQNGGPLFDWLIAACRERM